MDFLGVGSAVPTRRLRSDTIWRISLAKDTRYGKGVAGDRQRVPALAPVMAALLCGWSTLPAVGAKAKAAFAVPPQPFGRESLCKLPYRFTVGNGPLQQDHDRCRGDGTDQVVARSDPSGGSLTARSRRRRSPNWRSLRSWPGAVASRFSWGLLQVTCW